MLEGIPILKSACSNNARSKGIPCVDRAPFKGNPYVDRGGAIKAIPSAHIGVWGVHPEQATATQRVKNGNLETVEIFFKPT